MAVTRRICVCSWLLATAVGVAPPAVILDPVRPAISPAGKNVATIPGATIDHVAVADAISNSRVAPRFKGQSPIVPTHAGWKNNENKWIEPLGRTSPKVVTRQGHFLHQYVPRASKASKESAIDWVSFIRGLMLAGVAVTLVGGLWLRQQAQNVESKDSATEIIALGGLVSSEQPKLAVAALASEAEVVSGFVSACSVNQDWQAAIDEIVEAAGVGHETGFAFICEQHTTAASGLAAVAEQLRERLGVKSLIACVCSGSIGQAAGPAAEVLSGSSGAPVEVEDGAVLSVGLLREANATPFFLGENGGDTELVDRRARDGDVRSILMIADPLGPVETLLARLDDSFPKAVKAGGASAVLQVGSSSRGAFTPAIAIATEGNAQARLVSQGIAGLMLADIDVHTAVCQGCCGVGPPLRVTGVQGPVCTGLGGRPAGEAVRMIFSAVDPPTRQKMQANLTIGFGGVGENENSVGEGDWLVRGISNVSPEGGLVVGDGVAEGQPMRFHVRDRESAEADLALMTKRYRLERTFQGGLGDPIGCLLFTCNGRGEGLYGRRHVDARAAVDALGEESGNRVAGFFCNGEIGSPGLALGGGEADTPTRPVALHGFTAVFAMLVPAAAK